MKSLSRLSWEVVRFVVYGALTMGLALFVLEIYNLRLRFERVPEEASAPVEGVQFEASGETGLLTQDFVEDVPRNVIFLISDGLGFAHVKAARAELVGLDGRLSFERMPITGWLSTHSVSALGTDSAASGTALATGYKTKPGRLAVDTKGQPLHTLFEAAHAGGLVTGLVTDSYLWDATAAAFLVHVESRREFGEIISQMAASKAEILLGTVHRTMPLSEASGQGALERFEQGGFTVAAGWDQLRQKAAAPGRLVGLFEEGEIAHFSKEPSLVELTRIALGRLESASEAGPAGGFVLVVESEELDTSSHRNDYQRMVTGVQTLQEVTSLALEFARRDRHTLVLLTADHETGGLLLFNASPGEPIKVRWGSTGHTGVPVPLYAYGPGAERLAGARDNTEVAPILADLLGVSLGASP